MLEEDSGVCLEMGMGDGRGGGKVVLCVVYVCVESKILLMGWDGEGIYVCQFESVCLYILHV